VRAASPPWAAPPPGRQSPHANCAYPGDNTGHDHEHMDQFPTAATTGPASFTASAAPTSTAIPRPLPPLPWVCAPSGVPSLSPLLLVPGGGALPVADPAGEPVDGAGIKPLGCGGVPCIVGTPSPGRGPGRAHGGVLQRGAGLPVRRVPAAA
jgi:hypothetical protein